MKKRRTYQINKRDEIILGAVDARANGVGNANTTLAGECGSLLVVKALDGLGGRFQAPTSSLPVSRGGGHGFKGLDPGATRG